MIKPLTRAQLSEIPTLSLAYLGDAVFELLVREHLLRSGNYPPGELNRQALSFVTAYSQSNAIEKLMESLTEDETDIFRRGRNAKQKGSSKRTHTPQYLKATGLECVFGYLKLNGADERIAELFDIIAQKPNPT